MAKRMKSSVVFENINEISMECSDFHNEELCDSDGELLHYERDSDDSNH